jgi:hypothetical protein
MKRTWLVASLALSAGSTHAYADAVSLSCSGSLHNYVALLETALGPSAATLDIDKKAFLTPVGNFHITKVEENSINFDEPADALKVFGSLDRVTGEVNVFWRTAAEDEKMKLRIPHKVQVHVNLKCVVAKRMF